MASTITVSLAGKTAKPHGMGMKVVAGQMDLAFANGIESVAAAELDLKKIYYLHVSNGTTTGVIVQTNVELPGSVDNAATVTVSIDGTFPTAAEGTLNDVSFLAIGE